MTKIGIGLGKIALSGASTLFHGLNEGKNSNEISGNVGSSMLFSEILQGGLIGGSYIKFDGGVSPKWIE